MSTNQRLRTFAVVIASIAAFAGCASSNEMGLTTLNAGLLDPAEKHFRNVIQEGEPMGWNNLGVVYERRGMRELATQHYVVAARYGVPIAQQNLIRLGQPVPAVDLAVANAGADSSWLLQALLVGATSYQQGRNSVVPQPRPPALLTVPASPVKCVTKQNVLTKALETVCN